MFSYLLDIQVVFHPVTFLDPWVASLCGRKEGVGKFYLLIISKDNLLLMALPCWYGYLLGVLSSIPHLGFSKILDTFLEAPSGHSHA
jgi:hypothetical protein